MNRRSFLRGLVGVAAAFPVVKAAPSILVPRKPDIVRHTQFVDSYERSSPLGREDVLDAWNAQYVYGYDVYNDQTYMRLDVPVNGQLWHDFVRANGHRSEEDMRHSSELVFRRFLKQRREHGQE